MDLGEDCEPKKGQIKPFSYLSLIRQRITLGANTADNVGSRPGIWELGGGKVQCMEAALDHPRFAAPLEIDKVGDKVGDKVCNPGASGSASGSLPFPPSPPSKELLDLSTSGLEFYGQLSWEGCGNCQVGRGQRLRAVPIPGKSREKGIFSRCCLVPALHSPGGCCS